MKLSITYYIKYNINEDNENMRIEIRESENREYETRKHKIIIFPNMKIQNINKIISISQNEQNSWLGHNSILYHKSDF